jgi:PTH1 family peptidyl-tRNA hydrolase
MKLIVGLGNPGKKYENNRHNIGYHFVDYLIRELTDYGLMNYLKNTQFVNTLINNEKIILTKTNTFMNQSGIAVKSCVTRYTLHVTRDLFVVHDDLDIPLGKFKIQKGVGPKLHNGIESIEKELETKNFWRVRIGVDNRQPGKWIDGESYVLQDFEKEEKEILATQVFPKIFERLKKEFYVS